MKKYLLVALSVVSFAVDLSVSAGSGLLFSDIYSIGAVHVIDTDELPMNIELGANLHFHFQPRFWNDKEVLATHSVHAKLLFPFSETSDLVVGQSLHFIGEGDLLLPGGMFGYRRQVFDDQSFQVSFEAIKLGNYADCSQYVAPGTPIDFRISFMLTKSFTDQ